MGTVLLIIGVIGMLVIPVVSLIFVLTHWEDAKKPFLIQLVGWLLFAAGLGLSHE